MLPYIIVIIVLASFILLNDILVPLIISIIVGKILFDKHLVRHNPEEWGRGHCSEPDDYEQMMMWNEGLQWAEDNKQYRSEEDVMSERNHLFGEYYNFGKRRTIIILPGRRETLQYSYFYGPVYQDLGFNILVVDKRAHGLSDGMYEDGGQHTYVDLFAWANLLKEKYNIWDITLHGICIGSETCIHAFASEDCPDNITKMVADGMYRTFSETFKNHMKKDRRTIFPNLQFTMMWAKHYTKADFTHNGPIKQIKKVTKPILLLYSEKDVFSTPEQANDLYKKCPSEHKKLVFFKKGRHSHVLYHNREQYRTEIKAFLDELE